MPAFNLSERLIVSCGCLFPIEIGMSAPAVLSLLERDAYYVQLLKVYSMWKKNQF